MALRIMLMGAALRAILTASATGRHRRPPWAVRAATAARDRARYVFGIPAPADRYRPAHAARPAAAYSP